MYISREDVINPGLFPVVHVTDVVVAALTGQYIPSIVMVYLVVSVRKLVPVNVRVSPPVTEPNLGLIAVSKGVFAPS